jgi:hypothetical protein
VGELGRVAKKLKIYMGICSTGAREDAQNYFLRRIEKKYADKIEFVYPEVFVGRIFHDYARNKYVEQFLATDCDLIWFLDSDIVPPERVLDLVTEHYDKWSLAGAPYPVWMTIPGYDTQQVVFCVYRKLPGDDKLHAAKVPEEGGLDFVEGLATGCLFIKREVIQKMTKPYFEFKYHPETREIVEGEDLGFCRKVGDLGYSFFIDYSMLCHHYKKISLLDVSNYTQIQINQTIDACDRSIQQIIAKKKLEWMERKSQPAPQKSRLILPNT